MRNQSVSLPKQELLGMAFSEKDERVFSGDPTLINAERLSGSDTRQP
jgi:hypothetical protein